MVALQSQPVNEKYAMPAFSEISHMQCATISKQLENEIFNISQENSPFELASKARDLIGIILTDLNHGLINRFTSDAGIPYYLLKGLLDVSGLPATPTDDTSPAELTWRRQAATMLGCLKLFGANAASFEDEMGGRLFHMVMPAKNSDRSLLRSTKALNFHTEVVNGLFEEEKPYLGAPIAPSIFSLACMRNPNRVKTTVLPLSKIIGELSGKSILALMKPDYVANSQSSFDREIVIKGIQVLVPLASGHLGIRYSGSKLCGTTNASKQALAELREVIDSFDDSNSVVLEPGDVLVLNNRLCLHGRGEVATTSSFDGNDRWLLRLYGYTERGMSFARFKPGSSHVMEVLDHPDVSRRLAHVPN